MPPKQAQEHDPKMVGSAKVTKSSLQNKRLPLARVKKIAKMDEDVIAISNSAALIIAGATVSFKQEDLLRADVLIR